MATSAHVRAVLLNEFNAPLGLESASVLEPGPGAIVARVQFDLPRLITSYALEDANDALADEVAGRVIKPVLQPSQRKQFDIPA